MNKLIIFVNPGKRDVFLKKNWLTYYKLTIAMHGAPLFEHSLITANSKKSSLIFEKIYVVTRVLSISKQHWKVSSGNTYFVKSN